ncbi:DUF5682 family protein [Cellulomonas sp. P5_C5]
MTDVEILGIRHHGPGSARAVLAALERLQPDVVLIEGPADADPLTSFVADPGLEPPVALLAWSSATPGLASFWPMAVFSPEWQALRWAHEHDVPVRFCDLPSAAVLARRAAAQSPEDEVAVDGSTTPGDDAGPAADAGPADGAGPADDLLAVRRDPLGALARAAGYDDAERWWEDVVESRPDAPTPFPAITAAMAELRAAAGPLPADEEEHEAVREAYMRQTMRAAMRDGAERVAVVCGAWHAPALDGKLPAAAADARLLRGLPKVSSSVTWVPWTSSRLAAASGYGAGIVSPGWYHHLFTAPDHTVARWLTRVAGVLRAEDLPVSSAHVIEGVRLAETLAGLRGRPAAGLDEVQEATRAVLCDGDDTMLDLVTRRLVVGESLGHVPATVPTVPLEADLRATARRLRIVPEALERTLELDLRKDTDLQRSRLLHRLRLLGIDWGTAAQDTRRSTGTFRETWSIRWEPALSVAIIEAAVWGTTVPTAAAAAVRSQAAAADLAGLTGLVAQVLLADLPDAVPPLLEALRDRAARELDVTHLMAALPPLVRAQRYSDVRGTDVAELARVADALLIRVCAGLPALVTGIDDDAARTLRTSVDAVHAAVLLAESEADTARWLQAVHGVADRDDVSGVLVGRAARLLRDVGRLAPDEAARRLGRALSVGADAPAKAAWIEGFLDGGGLLLARDADLLGLLDTWVAGLTEQEFTDVLPLVRRTFGSFAPPERRAVGEAVRRGPGVRAVDGAAATDLDLDLARPALRTVATILGVPA